MWDEKGMRNIQRFEACWWPILCMSLSVKIQFPGLKSGWSEREASQAVSQVLLSANKSLQNKYLNEGWKKKLVWPISSSKNSWGGPWKKNVMQREWVLKIRWKLNKLLEKRGEERGGEKRGVLIFLFRFLWVRGRCLSTAFSPLQNRCNLWPIL